MADNLTTTLAVVAIICTWVVLFLGGAFTVLALLFWWQEMFRSVLRIPFQEK